MWNNFKIAVFLTVCKLMFDLRKLNACFNFLKYSPTKSHRILDG